MPPQKTQTDTGTVISMAEMPPDPSIPTMAPSQNSVVPVAPPQVTPAPRVNRDKLLKAVFLAGFASIFLINAANALINPFDFIKLLEANFLAQKMGHYGLLVHIVAVNDLLLGILIILGRRKKFVWVWAGAWLLLVAGVKMFYLISLKV